MVGQINLGTKEGNLIFEISKRNDVENIVEIGTWNGMGSTMCVIKSIIESKKNKNFISIELYPDMYKVAVNNLSDYSEYVTLLNGKIIDYDDLFWFNHESINFNDDLHAKLYFKKDLEYIKDSKNVINLLPDKIDLLILDGGEYSTYPEWIKLKDRTKIVVLDDSNILKTKKIREEIISSEIYQTIFDDLETRNGFSIFEKK